MVFLWSSWLFSLSLTSTCTPCPRFCPRPFIQIMFHPKSKGLHPFGHHTFFLSFPLLNPVSVPRTMFLMSFYDLWKVYQKTNLKLFIYLQNYYHYNCYLYSGKGHHTFKQVKPLTSSLTCKSSLLGCLKVPYMAKINSSPPKLHGPCHPHLQEWGLPPTLYRRHAWEPKRSAQLLLFSQQSSD